MFFVFTVALLVFGNYYLEYLGLSDSYARLTLLLVCLSTLPQMCGFIVYPYLARVNMARLLARVNLLGIFLTFLLLWFLTFSTITLNIFLSILILSRCSEFIAAYAAEKRTGVLLFRSFFIWPLLKK